MTQSQSFITFYTLLLGLGLAVLLTGVANFVRHKRVGEAGPLTILLTVLIVFEFLSGWAGADNSFNQVNADIATLLLPFGTGACYFIAAVLMFPGANETEATALETYVTEQSRTIALLLFVANALLICAEYGAVRQRFASDPAYFWQFYLPYNGAILACYAVATESRARRVQLGALTVLLAVYLWVTIGQRV
ncbi:MAG: hypothetical protein ABIR63_08265 [Sphingomicrobium sp.]